MHVLSLLFVSFLTLVELNCENLFDTQHDSLKQDQEFLPESQHNWTPRRYWRKLNRLGQTIMACGKIDSLEVMPDLVVLTEVENDTVMRDLTRRSVLRTAGYEYVMTSSPDLRGIDVALMWSRFAFRMISHHAVRVAPPSADFRPTRDILYACGEIINRDTLHIIAVHAPSRSGGERHSRPYRMKVAQAVCGIIDSVRALSPNARIVVAGDFNDYVGDKPLDCIVKHGMEDVSANVQGTHGAKGTYRWHGEWASLDHILCSSAMTPNLLACRVVDWPYLLEEDEKYGGVKPRRTYLGPRYIGGLSDHLPLVALFGIPY